MWSQNENTRWKRRDRTLSCWNRSWKSFTREQCGFLRDDRRGCRWYWEDGFHVRSIVSHGENGDAFTSDVTVGRINNWNKADEGWSVLLGKIRRIRTLLRRALVLYSAAVVDALFTRLYISRWTIIWQRGILTGHLCPADNTGSL